MERRAAAVGFCFSSHRSEFTNGFPEDHPRGFAADNKMMNRSLAAAVAGIILYAGSSRAQDAAFATENLKYSRDFFAKVHFIASASLPDAFKYDRYPSGGPERLQCGDGTYARQQGQPWRHTENRARRGEPIDHPERGRFISQAGSNADWGRVGEPVDEKTALKLDGWVKLVDAALNAEPAGAKLVEKSEPDGRAQWVFESLPANGDLIATRLTFRKPISDKAEQVLLHEFSGSLRPAGGERLREDSAQPAKLGFGYMMPVDGGDEVSEFVWEEMQGLHEKKPAAGAQKARSPAPKGR